MSVVSSDLQDLISRLKIDHNLTPIFGAELEFYVGDEIDLAVWCSDLGLAIKPEKGLHQYEFDISPTADIHEFIDSIDQGREMVAKYGRERGVVVDFSPKPRPDDYGSSMHIHLNFLEDEDVEKYANILCNYAHKYIEYFVPDCEDWKRLDQRFMAPTHICWGGNNRTCLVRIPDSLPRRLEHRLASSNIDPSLPVYGILYSILQGVEAPHKLKQFPKIHGNAFDPQYKLVSLLVML